MTPLRVPTPEDEASDAAKHAWCRERTGMPAVVLPCPLYDMAERQGWDMRYYVPTRLIQTKTEGKPLGKGATLWRTQPEPDDRHQLRARPRS